jgi:hypothetical protein
MQRPHLPADVEALLPLELDGHEENNQATRHQPISNRFRIRFVLIGMVAGLVMLGFLIAAHNCGGWWGISSQTLSFFIDTFLFCIVFVFAFALLFRRGKLYLRQKSDYVYVVAMASFYVGFVLGIFLGCLVLGGHSSVSVLTFLALLIINGASYYLALRIIVVIIQREENAEGPATSQSGFRLTMAPPDE